MMTQKDSQPFSSHTPSLTWMLLRGENPGLNVHVSPHTTAACFEQFFLSTLFVFITLLFDATVDIPTCTVILY